MVIKSPCMYSWSTKSQVVPVGAVLPLARPEVIGRTRMLRRNLDRGPIGRPPQAHRGMGERLSVGLYYPGLDLERQRQRRRLGDGTIADRKTYRIAHGLRASWRPFEQIIYVKRHAHSIFALHREAEQNCLSPSRIRLNKLGSHAARRRAEMAKVANPCRHSIDTTHR